MPLSGLLLDFFLNELNATQIPRNEIVNSATDWNKDEGEDWHDDRHYQEHEGAVSLGSFSCEKHQKTHWNINQAEEEVETSKDFGVLKVGEFLNLYFHMMSSIGLSLTEINEVFLSRRPYGWMTDYG